MIEVMHRLWIKTNLFFLRQKVLDRIVSWTYLSSDVELYIKKWVQRKNKTGFNNNKGYLTLA